jgi:hypothetical protein
MLHIQSFVVPRGISRPLSGVNEPWRRILTRSSQ